MAGRPVDIWCKNGDEWCKKKNDDDDDDDDDDFLKQNFLKQNFDISIDERQST